MGKIKVLLDTDVIISSLLSQEGASYEIINNSKIEKIITSTIKKGAVAVSKRHQLKLRTLERIFTNTKTISLDISRAKLLKNYSIYVFDDEDAHIIAGAKLSKSKFLLTHNIRHYNLDKIRSELGIITMKPGEFLQYLRSQKN